MFIDPFNNIFHLLYGEMTVNIHKLVLDIIIVFIIRHVIIFIIKVESFISMKFTKVTVSKYKLVKLRIVVEPQTSHWNLL